MPFLRATEGSQAWSENTFTRAEGTVLLCHYLSITFTPPVRHLLYTKTISSVFSSSFANHPVRIHFRLTYVFKFVVPKIWFQAQAKETQ